MKLIHRATNCPIEPAKDHFHLHFPFPEIVILGAFAIGIFLGALIL